MNQWIVFWIILPSKSYMYMYGLDKNMKTGGALFMLLKEKSNTIKT